MTTSCTLRADAMRCSIERSRLACISTLDMERPGESCEALSVRWGEAKAGVASDSVLTLMAAPPPCTPDTPPPPISLMSLLCNVPVRFVPSFPKNTRR